MFAAFLAVQTHERTASRDLFTASQRQLDGTIGLINTCLLLSSLLVLRDGVAAVKLHLVGMHFMELKHAPRPLRLAFDGWISVVTSLVVGLLIAR